MSPILKEVELELTVSRRLPKGTAVEMKWIRYNVPLDIFDKFKKKAASEGYSLYEASRHLVFKYVRGDFDIANVSTTK